MVLTAIGWASGSSRSSSTRRRAYPAPEKPFPTYRTVRWRASPRGGKNPTKHRAALRRLPLQPTAGSLSATTTTATSSGSRPSSSNTERFELAVGDGRELRWQGEQNSASPYIHPQYLTIS